MAGLELELLELGQLGDLRAVEPLIQVLGDPYSFNTAVEALRRLGAVEPLLKVLLEKLDDRQANTRKDYPEPGELGDAHAVEPLIIRLGDTYSFVREAATKALGNLGGAKLLVKAFDDENLSVRKGAAQALGELGDACAVEALIQVLGDSARSVREAAAEALGKLGDARAVEARPGLGSVDGDVRVAAAKALGKLGEPHWAAIFKGEERDFCGSALLRMPTQCNY